MWQFSGALPGWLPGSVSTSVRLARLRPYQCCHRLSAHASDRQNEGTYQTD